MASSEERRNTVKIDSSSVETNKSGVVTNAYCLNGENNNIDVNNCASDNFIMANVIVESNANANLGKSDTSFALVTNDGIANVEQIVAPKEQNSAIIKPMQCDSEPKGAILSTMPMTEENRCIENNKKCDQNHVALSVTREISSHDRDDQIKHKHSSNEKRTSSDGVHRTSKKHEHG